MLNERKGKEDLLLLEFLFIFILQIILKLKIIIAAETKK